MCFLKETVFPIFGFNFISFVLLFLFLFSLLTLRLSQNIKIYGNGECFQSHKIDFERYINVTLTYTLYYGCP